VIVELTGLDLRSGSAIEVFPNPTDGRLVFKLPDGLEGRDLRMTILDVSGRYIVSSFKLDVIMQEAIIDIGKNSPGQYTYIIRDEESGNLYRGMIIIR